MPGPLSKDLRERFVRAWKSERETTVQLAARFGIREATVSRWKRLVRETGSTLPRAHGGGQRRRIQGEKERELQRLVEKHPDWTEAEFTEELRKNHSLSVSAVTVGRAIRRMGYTVKKRPSKPRNEIDLTLSDEEPSTSNQSEQRPLHVWFLWTKPARTRK